MPDRTGQLVIDFMATARREHPIQSFMAADKKNKSDTLSADRLDVLKAVYWHPGRTAKLLDTLYRLNGKAHRRAPELANMGLIYRDKSGSEMRLYITEEGHRKLNR